MNRRQFSWGLWWVGFTMVLLALPLDLLIPDCLLNLMLTRGITFFVIGIVMGMVAGRTPLAEVSRLWPALIGVSISMTSMVTGILGFLIILGYMIACLFLAVCGGALGGIIGTRIRKETDSSSWG